MHLRELRIPNSIHSYLIPAHLWKTDIQRQWYHCQLLNQQPSEFLCCITNMDEDAFVRNQNYTFFYKQPRCQGFSVKNGLKVKQLVK